MQYLTELTTQLSTVINTVSPAFSTNKRQALNKEFLHRQTPWERLRRTLSDDWNAIIPLFYCKMLYYKAKTKS